MSTATIDQQFIEYVVKSLVSNPDAVKVDRIIDEKGVLLTLTVDPVDLGRVIGKKGATAQSLRTLLRALGTKQEARYNLKIFDNGVPKPDRAPRREEDRGSAENREDNTRISKDQSSEEVAESLPVEKPEETVNSNDSTDSSVGTESTESKENTETTETSIERTRRELEDLDDLDI